MSETIEPVEDVDTGADGGNVWGYPRPHSYFPIVTVSTPDTKWGWLKVDRYYDINAFLITLFFIGFISAGVSALVYLLLWIWIDEPPIILFALTAILVSGVGCLFRRSNDAPTDYRFDLLAFCIFLGLSYAAYPFSLDMQNSSEASVTKEVLYQQEYNLEDITAPLEKPAGTAVNADGETIEIGVYTYKGENILFETPEQLQEKMAEVDAGTFLKGDTDE